MTFDLSPPDPGIIEEKEMKLYYVNTKILSVTRKNKIIRKKGS